MRHLPALLLLAVVVTAPASTHSYAKGQPMPTADSAGGDGWLLVANKNDHALGLIDPATGTQVAAVPENGITGHEVTASPDGTKAYVPIYGSGGVGKPGTDGQHIVVIDLASRAIEKTFTFSKGVRPHHPVFGPKDGLLYVTTELENTVTVFDPRTMTIVGTVSTDQPESHMLAISSDGTRGYTANVGPGTVSVLDLSNRKLVKVIPVATHTQRIALSVDDRWAFTSDTVQPRLAVIDTKSNTVSRWIPLPAPGYGAAPTPDGRWLVIAVTAANKVAVIDLKTFEVARTIDTPPSPQETLVRPDGTMVYVSCDVPGKVVAIRTSDWAVDKVIDAGKYADGLAWAKAR
jgi:DNA-binding beta-propeller fold protein YncE